MRLFDPMKRLVQFVPRKVPAANLFVGLNLANTLVAMALFGTHQLFAPEPDMLFRMGALVPAALFQGEYWRAITYGFIHVGALHLAFNMIALSQVGPAIESEVGTARFSVAYLLSLLGGAAAELLARGPASDLIAGASGGLFGLVGFGISYWHFYGGQFGREQRAFFLRWAAYGFLFGLLVGAAHGCHFGGLLAGSLCGFLVERERRYRDMLTPIWGVLSALLGLASALSFALMATRSF